jgi:hypothetical protein
VTRPAIKDILPRSRCYAGIGSRQTPPEIEHDIRCIVAKCNARGYMLRSGAAEVRTRCSRGTPQGRALPALEAVREDMDDGVSHCVLRRVGGRVLPGRNTHPRWDRCTDAARKLHARNAHQILGINLNDPVDFVVCWTPNGAEVGGTRTGIVIARNFGIPVWNLANERDRAEWAQFGRLP